MRSTGEGEEGKQKREGVKELKERGWTRVNKRERGKEGGGREERGLSRREGRHGVKHSQGMSSVTRKRQQLSFQSRKWNPKTWALHTSRLKSLQEKEGGIIQQVLTIY